MAISGPDATTIATWIKARGDGTAGASDTQTVANWIRSHWQGGGTDAQAIAAYASARGRATTPLQAHRLIGENIAAASQRGAHAGHVVGGDLQTAVVSRAGVELVDGGSLDALAAANPQTVDCRKTAD